MASQVLSGTSNPTYTNNTGENVRVVINYMKSLRSNIGQGRVVSDDGRRVGEIQIYRESLVINWAGVSAGYTSDGRIASRVAGANFPTYFPPVKVVIGRNLASTSLNPNTTNNLSYRGGTTANVDDPNIEGPILDNELEPFAFPTELMLAPGQTFSAVCGVYNIVVIPENG